MNRIYNIIWSKAKERWIVVSEKVKGNGKVPSSPLRSIAFLAAMFASSGQAYALDPGSLPAGAQITSGTGSIAISGNRMTVNQSSQKMIANWQSFNIGENASVRFNQPNSSAVALNRISDQNPSQIMGSLSANGLVFLLNQAGIIFGKNAMVNVGGLVASSLNMLDSDFLAGKYKFTNGGSAGPILNQGAINVTDGHVFAFIAPKVTNEGSITANSGNVLLAAGDQVSLDFNGDGLITYTVDRGTIDALVENKGLIKANGGLVVMTAKAAAALQMATVSNNGVIEAQTIQNKGGRIMLISDMENGQTTISGTLDASAPNGGNGGFIETSGRELTVIDGATITTLAPFGNAGTWLIDPVDFTVSAGVGALTSSGIGGTTLTNSLSNTDVIIATDPNPLIGENGDIFVNSAVNISSHTLSLLADGAVTINASISGSGGQLVLQSGTNGAANKPVIINSSILFSGDGNLKITSTGGVQSYAEIQAYGLLELYGTGAFNLNFTGNASDFDKFTALVDGSINLYENTDSLHIQPEGVTATGNVTLRAKEELHVDGPISITGPGNLVLQISENTSGNNVIITTSPITLNSGSVSFVSETGTGAYTIGSSITASAGGITFDQPVLLSNNPLISCNGLLTFNSTVTLSDFSDTILEANDFLFNGSVTGNNTQQITLMPYNVSGNMTIGTGENIDLSNISNFTSLTFGRTNGTGTVTLSGPTPKTPYTFTSSIILRSGGSGGSVVIDNPISTTDAQLTFIAGGALSINQSLETKTGAISLVGDVITIADKVFSSSGAITISTNTLTLSGTATLSSAGSLIIFPKTTGATIGIAGGSGTLALPASYFSSNFVDGFSDITIGNATTDNITIGGDITLNDNFSLISAGSVTINGALTATGNNTIALKGAGTVTEGASGSLVADKLVLLGGNVTLDKTGNKVTTLAAIGVDNLTYLNSDVLNIGTAGGIAGINANGTVNVATVTGNLTILQPIATTNASLSAVTLNAGSNTAVKTSTGGDIIISGASITVGSGGLAKLYTGSISGSIGLTSLIGSGSSQFRYASDESTTNYSLALSAGTYAIYREQPLLTVTPGSNTITYGDTTPGLAGSFGSYANGDTSPGTVTGTATWTINGSAPSASYTAGSYDVSYSSGWGSSLGYGFTDNVSSINELAVNPKTVTLSATKIYDGTTSLAGAVTIVTGVGSETLTYSNAFASDTNAATANKSISTITLADGSGLASNYQLPTLSSATAPVTIIPKTVTLSATKIYDGTTSLAGAVTIMTGVGSETLTYSNAVASDTNVATANKSISTIMLADGSGLASNYQLPTLSSATAPLTITPKTVTLSATKSYDGTASLAGAVTIVTGIGSETLTYSNAVASDANVATTNKSISTIILADGSGLASNYELPTLSSATAPLTITPKTVTLSATKIYDGTASLAGAVTIVTGVGSETLTYSNAVASDANVATANKSISTIMLGDGSGLASNYELPTLSSATAPLTITPKTVTLSATKIYDGTSSLAGAVTIVTGVGGETLTYTNALASNTNVDTANNSISTITLADGTGLASNYELPTLSSATAPVTIITDQTSLYSLANIVSSSVVSSIQSASTSTTISGTGNSSSPTSSPVITSEAGESSSAISNSVTTSETGENSSAISSSATTSETGENSSATTTVAGESSSATTTVAGESSSAASSSAATNAETAANTGSKEGSNTAATRAQMDAGSMRPGLASAMPGSAFNFGTIAQITENTFATSSLAEFVSSPDQLSLSNGTPVFGKQRFNAASKKTRRSDAPPDPVAFGTLGTLGYLTVYLFAMFNKNR